jgi:hypothetical protein
MGGSSAHVANNIFAIFTYIPGLSNEYVIRSSHSSSSSFSFAKTIAYSVAKIRGI